MDNLPTRRRHWLAALVSVAWLGSAALPALALASLLVVRRPPRPAPQDWTWWALSAPLLALGAVIPSLYVDSYLHWLPNAFYMVETGHFPAAPLGGFPSLHPSYPPALGLITYFSSVLTGGALRILVSIDARLEAKA